MDVFSDLYKAPIKPSRKPPATYQGTLTKAVADYIEQHPGSTSYTIGQALGVSCQRLLSTVYRLENAKVLYSKHLPPKRGTVSEKAPEIVKHYWRAE